MSKDQKPGSAGNNTASVVENGLGETFVQAERHEARPVEGVLIVDLTASRNETRDAFIADFIQGSEEFEALIEEVSTLGNVALTLIVHNGDGVRNIGRFESPNDLAHALSQIECKQARTQIVESLNNMPVDADFVIVNGDTTDGPLDTQESLAEIAELSGIPVIPLLEHTTGTDGTKPEHIEALRQMGEASGVEGGPFAFDTRMSLLDFVAVSAAATRGPRAIEELKEKGDIPQEVWDAIPQEALASISEASANADETLTSDETLERIIDATVRQSGKGVNVAGVGYSQPLPSVDQDGDGINIANVAKDTRLVISVKGDETVIEASSAKLASHTSQNKGVAQDKPAGMSRRGMLGLSLAGLVMAGAAGGGVAALLDNDDHTHAEPTALDRFNALSDEMIMFDPGSADLSPQGMNMLARTAEIMRSDDSLCVTVSAYASDDGNPVLNQALSEQRAEAIRNQLVYGLGVNPDQVKAIGLGSLNPSSRPAQFDRSATLTASCS